LTKLLVVDDEASIRALLRAIFAGAGYHVRLAADADEAKAACLAEPFDVVLSDIMMPGMTGHDLAQWVAEHYPATRLVLMSGYDAGCQGCPYSPRCKLLTKPFLAAEAIGLVEEALRTAA
jgi:DNA-binding NtrC family response regulator